MACERVARGRRGAAVAFSATRPVVPFSVTTRAWLLPTNRRESPNRLKKKRNPLFNQSLLVTVSNFQAEILTIVIRGVLERRTRILDAREVG